MILIKKGILKTCNNEIIKYLKLIIITLYDKKYAKL